MFFIVFVTTANMSRYFSLGSAFVDPTEQDFVVNNDLCIFVIGSGWQKVAEPSKFTSGRRRWFNAGHASVQAEEAIARSLLANHPELTTELEVQAILESDVLDRKSEFQRSDMEELLQAVSITPLMRVTPVRRCAHSKHCVNPYHTKLQRGRLRKDNSAVSSAVQKLVRHRNRRALAMSDPSVIAKALRICPATAELVKSQSETFIDKL